MMIQEIPRFTVLWSCLFSCSCTSDVTTHTFMTSYTQMNIIKHIVFTSSISYCWFDVQSPRCIIFSLHRISVPNVTTAAIRPANSSRYKPYTSHSAIDCGVDGLVVQRSWVVPKPFCIQCSNNPCCTIARILQKIVKRAISSPIHNVLIDIW